MQYVDVLSTSTPVLFITSILKRVMSELMTIMKWIKKSHSLLIFNINQISKLAPFIQQHTKMQSTSKQSSPRDKQLQQRTIDFITSSTNTMSLCIHCGSQYKLVSKCDTCDRLDCPNTFCIYHGPVIDTDCNIHFPNCEHAHKACMNCIKNVVSDDYGYVTYGDSKIYECQACSQYKCTDCEPPVSVYPMRAVKEPSLYDRYTEHAQFDWDMNERITELGKKPFQCPKCYAELYPEAT
jgi:hypothetical protein